MKKTNVMIEVSDELYDSIVYPYKKKKSFGKLVVQLLEAYMSNDSIYSYINGSLDGLEEEANKELLNDLNQMAQNLNMLDALHNEAESLIDNGERFFSSRGESVRKEEKEVAVSNIEHEESSSENKNTGLSEEDVKRIVQDALASALGSMMLNGMVGGSQAFTDNVVNSVNNSVKEESAKKEDTAKEVIKEEPVFENVVEDTTEDLSYVEDVPYEDEEELSSSEEEAVEALDSLLGSLNF